MTAHHHHLLARIGQQCGTARALVLEGQPAVVLVDHDSVVERTAVLIDRRQAAVLQAGKHRGVDRMDVHDASRMGAGPVHPAVQAPGRRIRRIGAFQRFRVLGVHQQQIARLDAGEMHLVRVHQKPRAGVIDREREVVGHPFVHVEPGCPAECRRQIDPLGPVFHVMSLIHRALP